MFIETPNPPSDGNEPHPLEKEWVSGEKYPYQAWTNDPPPEKDFEPQTDENEFILEILNRAYDAGLIDDSDIWSLGIGVPELVKRFKERATQKGLDFQEIFKDFDIS